MSSKKTTQRRLSLMAGSSLAAATIAVAAFTGASFAPTAALAANECNPVGVDPSANGPAADSYTCSGATTYQTSGVTYSSNGDLTANVLGQINVGSVGINLTGNTTDDVTFNSDVFAGGGRVTGTSGAVIDVTSSSGNISIITNGLLGTAQGVTHGVRAISTNGGDIAFRQEGFVAASVFDATAPGAEAAVALTTNGGDIDVAVEGSRAVNGRLRGVLAQTSGAGSVTLNVESLGGLTASEIDGIAAVDVIAGTGGVDINLTAGTVNGGAGHAIRVASASAVDIDNTTGVVRGSVDFSGVTAGGVSFDNFGAGVGTQGNSFPGVWKAKDHSTFTSQADTVRLMGGKVHSFATGTTIDFGGGQDVFVMSGILAANSTTITNLEAFNNSGVIFLGGDPTNNHDLTVTDSTPDDVLQMAGTTFTGSGASQLIFDVVLGGQAQVGCETIVTADCLYLPDGSTAGSTLVTINDASPEALISGYVPGGITIIDVSGSGVTAEEHFTLDLTPTGGYEHPLYGPGFDRPGEFVYLFRFDEENQRFVLISQPKGRNLFEYAVLSGAAQSIWHMTAATVTDRQTDLRGGAEGGSVWVRTAGEYTKRDISTEFVGFDDTFAFDNGYKLYAGTIMAGMDLATGRSGGYDYALGAQIGYVGSSLDLNASDSSGKFTGATGGVYGSVWSNRLFVDATFNMNGLALDYDAPALGSKTTTYVNSVGARLDGGWRMMLTERTYLEPLASAAWVRTSFEEISLSGAEVQPADAQSRRAALGARLGADLTEGPLNVSYFVAGRAWNEFDGQTKGVVHNPGADLPFHDEFDGAFGEAELGVNVFNEANTLSGFLSSGVKWKDGYSAVNLSLGVRMAW